jgi:hypothetical protein
MAEDELTLSQQGEAVRDRIERQRMESLALAQSRRIQVAELKKAIAERKVDPVHLLEGLVPKWEETLMHATVDHVLMSVPRFGRKTVDDILETAMISPKRKMKDLTPGQRQDLAVMVRLVSGRS